VDDAGEVDVLMEESLTLKFAGSLAQVHTDIRQVRLQHTATYCNALQHTATHCNTMQHAATHCNTLQPADEGA